MPYHSAAARADTVTERGDQVFCGCGIAQRLWGVTRNPRNDCLCWHEIEEEVLVRRSIYLGLHHSGVVLTLRARGAEAIALHGNREEC